MEITISEFRKNIKIYFDSALKNQTVCIERGGVHYNLTARLAKYKGEYIIENHTKTDKVAMPIPNKIIKSPSDVSELIHNRLSVPKLTTDKPLTLCPIHFTPMDSRKKCLSKQCKYN